MSPKIPVHLLTTAHVLQILYDSLEAVGGADAVAGMTRPTTDGLTQ
ncbi:MAG: hypothetical protein R2867_14345 [Caldilineaceae bacterium]